MPRRNQEHFVQDLKMEGVQTACHLGRISWWTYTKEEFTVSTTIKFFCGAKECSIPADSYVHGWIHHHVQSRHVSSLSWQLWTWRSWQLWSMNMVMLATMNLVMLSTMNMEAYQISTNKSRKWNKKFICKARNLQAMVKKCLWNNIFQ